MTRCTHHPHLQAWAMMQLWGLDKRPAWHVEWIRRVNRQMRAYLAMSRGVPS